MSDMKVQNGAGTVKQDVQTFIMQAARDGSEYQPMVLIIKWIKQFEEIVVLQFLR
jgi:hypothetical protein